MNYPITTARRSQLLALAGMKPGDITQPANDAKASPSVGPHHPTLADHRPTPPGAAMTEGRRQYLVNLAMSGGRDE